MRITRMRLVHFRNYTDERVSFDDGIQLICGSNAQGKTNLLEALYFCSTVRSNRTAQDRDLIQNEESSFLIDLSLYRRGRSEQLRVCVNERGKNLFLHGNPVRRVSDFIGEVNAVLFCPDDMNLFTSSPRIRRRFIDIELSKLSRRYTQTLGLFQKLLKERNALLKQNALDEVYLRVLSEQMADCEIIIMKQRQTFLQELFALCRPFYRSLAQDDTEIGFTYHTCLDSDHLDDREMLLQKYEKGRQRDLLSGQTNIGVHKDDVTFTVDGQNVNSFASQGQKRTLLLSMKAALCVMIKEKIKEYPILLLDDVFSELDEGRRQRLLSILPAQMQIFISTTDHLRLNETGRPVSFYEVEGGRILRR